MWISVKDKLPEVSDYDKTQWVLVCDKDGDIFVAQYMQSVIEPNENDIPTWYKKGKDACKADNILYWMELPEAPDSSKDQKESISKFKEDLKELKKHAQNIYDITMNERCEAKVQDLFSTEKGLHESMVELIDGLNELEDNLKYNNVAVANEQVVIGIEEKNRVVQAQIKRDTTIENLTELSRWLMQYLMELHDFRNKAISKEFDTYDKLQDYLIGQFPMLQGSGNHRLFRELGINKFNQQKVKDAVRHIKSKYGKDDE